MVETQLCKLYIVENRVQKVKTHGSIFCYATYAIFSLIRIPRKIRFTISMQPLLNYFLHPTSSLYLVFG